MSKKKILVGVLVLSMMVLIFSNFASQTMADSEVYIFNKGELLENTLAKLPLGSVKAESWLLQQLLYQKYNITGNMEQYPDYGSESGWLGGTGEDWERGPYYVRGLVALAYTLDDSDLKAKAQKWIDWSIDNQKPDGFFGPSSNTDWWPRMPMMMAIRDYYEATGKTDSRVLPFFEKYFRYQAANLPGRPLDSWAKARGGDNLDSVYWYYNETYDENNPNASKWLLDLATLIKNQTQDWTNEFTNTSVRQHVVNTMQALKMPMLYYQQSKDLKDKNALYNGIFNFGIDHGRVSGLPNSDEAARDNVSTRGTELCGVVEGMFSTEIALSISADAKLGDYLEKIAYNDLPNGFNYDLSGYAYYSVQNQVMATLGNHDFDCDHGDSSAFGTPSGFECCFANGHMGWPKFVQNMWMATANGGLALTAYGPNSVTAQVSGGKTAVFKQTTNYPFRDEINLQYDGETAEFPLLVRIPDWCNGAVVKVNGQNVTGVKSGEFLTINRTFTKGDVIDITLPMEIKTSTWYNDSVAVERGPLIYSLKIDEDWRTYDGNSARELKVTHKANAPLREVYPASKWNYGLVVDESNISSSFEVIENEIGIQPFYANNPPVTIKAKGQIIPEWILDGNKADVQPLGPTEANVALQEDVELIPYGSTRLKITQFPKIGENTDMLKVNGSKANILDLGKTIEFDNVIVPYGTDYTMNVSYTGNGGTYAVWINGKNVGSVDFNGSPVKVDNLRTLISDESLKFKDGNLNNVRFIGNGGITINEINFTITGGMTVPEILSTTSTSNSVTLNTNIQSLPYSNLPNKTINTTAISYKVLYGTESGNYTKTAYGFNTPNALISGLKPGTYYFVIEIMMGTAKRSSEVSVTVGGSQGFFIPDTSAPVVNFSDNFDIPGESASKWTKYDPENKITLDSGKYVFGKGTKVKSVINNGNTWTDYVIEGKISIDNVDTNNCGFMFRSTGIGNNPDEYNGYFVGIGKVAGATGVMVGYADGAWHNLKVINNIPITPNTEYTLKVVVFKNYLAVYFNGTFITSFKDTNNRFTSGTVGLRSYNESFKADDVTVRNVVESDLSIFNTEFPGDSGISPVITASLTDDFETDSGNWTPYGATSKIEIKNGKMNIGKDPNIKVVAGSSDWTNYVYETDITVASGADNNAGMMFRVTNAGSGPDAYNGYYFGIGKAGQAPGLVFGRADQNWNQIKTIPYAFEAGKSYKLKVIAYENRFAFYVDNELVGMMADNNYSKGMVGLRAYNEAFTADNVNVRPINEAELAVFDNAQTINAKAVSVFECVQVEFEKYSGASSYKILVGTQSGKYETEICDIKYNPYKNSAYFETDKYAIGGLENNKDYYFVVVALSGTTEVDRSKEIKIKAGYVESYSLTELNKLLSNASTYKASEYSADSFGNLQKSVSFANAEKADKTTQMGIALAESNLKIAIDRLIEVNTPKLTNSKYTVDNDKLTITVPANTEVSDFISSFSDFDIKVFEGDNQITSGTITSKMVLRYYVASELIEVYVIIIQDSEEPISTQTPISTDNPISTQTPISTDKPASATTEDKIDRPETSDTNSLIIFIIMAVASMGFVCFEIKRRTLIKK